MFSSEMNAVQTAFEDPVFRDLLSRKSNDFYSGRGYQRAPRIRKYYTYKTLPNGERKRQKGPVGPEIDYSVVNSDIRRQDIYPVCNIKLLHYILPTTEEWHALDHNELAIDIEKKHYVYPAKYDHVFTGLADPVKWTAYAMHYGIEYSGPRGYKFPKKKPQQVSKKKWLRFLRLGGIIPHHKRSASAKARRAAVTAARYPKGLPKDLLVLRNKVPARESYFKWKESNPSIPLSSFLKKEKVMVLNVPGNHVETPLIVVESLRKILGTVLLTPKVRKGAPEGPRKVFTDFHEPVSDRPKVKVFNPDDPSRPFLMWTTASLSQKLFERFGKISYYSDSLNNAFRERMLRPGLHPV